MPYSIDWYIPERVIYMKVYGQPTLDDLESASRDTVHLLDEGQEPVHLLIDDQLSERMPSNLREIQKRVDFMRHPALGWMIAVGDGNPVSNFVVPTVSKIIRVNFTRRKTLEEARTFLNKNDTTLDWSHTQPLHPL